MSLLFPCPCLASNVNVHYNGGFVPDIIQLCKIGEHNITRLYPMKGLYPYSLPVYQYISMFQPINSNNRFAKIKVNFVER